MSTKYSFPGDIMLLRAPEPKEEDYTDAETGICVHIRGVKNFRARVGIAAQVTELAQKIKGEKISLTDHRGEPLVPSDFDLVIACSVAACVTEPKLSALDWLKCAAETSLVSRIYQRVLVCNRDVEDPGTKTALEEAKEALDADPLAPNGSASA